MTNRILVIDDEEALRLLYTSELARAGYQVESAADADEAMEMFSKQHYDLAVVDIEMPGLNGLELLGKLREIDPSTPLVLNSAFSTYKADFKSWVADGYIVKSSDLEPLKSKIKELLVPSDK